MSTGFGDDEFDSEGRFLESRYDTPTRKFSVISGYFPSGSSGEHRQAAEFVLVGDINIAHQEIDLRNWRSNQKNSGFLPEERAWMTRLLSDGGLVDVFRTLNPKPDQYTWWSNRGQARQNNVGWRLDYHLATPGIAQFARREHIYLQQRFSDHAPLIIDYDLRW